MYSPTSVHLNDRASSHFFPLICPSSKILHILEQLKRDFPLYVCEFQSVQDAYHMINDFGELTDWVKEAALYLNGWEYPF